MLFVSNSQYPFEKGISSTRLTLDTAMQRLPLFKKVHAAATQVTTIKSTSMSTSFL